MDQDLRPGIKNEEVKKVDAGEKEKMWFEDHPPAFP
jgi:hypothetical protein